MKNENRWPLVALVGIVLAAVSAMLYLGVPEATITTLVGLVVVPALAAFGASQLAGAREQIGQVQQQTNGNLSRLVDLVEKQGQIIASLPALPGPSVPQQDGWPPAGADTTATSWPAGAPSVGPVG